MSINNKNLINKVCENIKKLKKEDLDKAIKKVNEEEIIDKVMMIDRWKVSGDNYTQDELNAISEFIDLYNQTKNKLTEYEKQMDLDYVDENYVSKDKVIECLDDIIDYFDNPSISDEDNQFLEKKKKELLEEK